MKKKYHIEIEHIEKRISHPHSTTENSNQELANLEHIKKVSYQQEYMNFFHFFYSLIRRKNVQELNTNVESSTSMLSVDSPAFCFNNCSSFRIMIICGVSLLKHRNDEGPYMEDRQCYFPPYLLYSNPFLQSCFVEYTFFRDFLSDQRKIMKSVVPTEIEER